MKKVVLKLDLQDDKAKRKALKMVATLSGIDSISMDMKEKKLTIVGGVDPIHVVRKLRKLWHAEILTVGPAKEPEKKKEQPKKEDDKKKEQNEQIAELWRAYRDYNTTYHYVHGTQENPSACAIS